MIATPGALDNQKSGLFIHLDSSENIGQQLNQKLAQQLVKPDKNLAIISSNQEGQILGIPYLTVNDTLYLGSKKNSINETELQALAAELAIPTANFQKKFSEVTLLNAIKLQLLLALIQNKKIIYLNDFFDQLDTKEIQHLLMLLHQVAYNEHLEIYCYTNNIAIANSNYVDATF
ncbi:hypothetical protein [Enterococcus sp. HY326]|uniref:hypothetical protein n=1 Tax=Enterococcus sp. HY326 TaxID=2971265 RepID=UPI00223F095E|nr:hypothetical protein [Enterococcus sp. HY326]